MGDRDRDLVPEGRGADAERDLVSGISRATDPEGTGRRLCRSAGRLSRSCAGEEEDLCLFRLRSSLPIDRKMLEGRETASLLPIT